MPEGLVDKLMQIFANSTRAAILYQLTRYKECSATDLARTLSQKVNNIYYHLRILEDNGIVNPPRSVIKRNYVEKYYSLSERFFASFDVDEYTWRQSQRKLSIEQRIEIAIAGFNLIASILRWRTEEYKQMSYEQMDKLWNTKEEWVTLSTFTKEQYKILVKRLEKTWLGTVKKFSDVHSNDAKPFTIIIAALSRPPNVSRQHLHRAQGTD